MALNTFIDNIKKDGYIVTVYKNEEKRVFKVKVTSEKTGANIVQLIPFECCVGTHPKILTKGIELPFYIGIHPDSNRCLSHNKKIIYANIFTPGIPTCRQSSRWCFRCVWFFAPGRAVSDCFL